MQPVNSGYTKSVPGNILESLSWRALGFPQPRRLAVFSAPKAHSMLSKKLIDPFQAHGSPSSRAYWVVMQSRSIKDLLMLAQPQMTREHPEELEIHLPLALSVTDGSSIAVELAIVR
ncbi:hypothetical protein E2P81_ATG07016 [Venturia nashicola]|uniref:Uncharacterized protein n=1 Tax=Venturia nashicola TaxID=86259 RepID=A0A4Z1NF33_9PEZI|nr:hypothetical protein E6O75_ATG07181 [Venturia nashicola]TLD19399.1 hypothetical protein E2P81_ATG07016 [Venturia nashicola]